MIAAQAIAKQTTEKLGAIIQKRGVTYKQIGEKLELKGDNKAGHIADYFIKKRNGAENPGMSLKRFCAICLAVAELSGKKLKISIEFEAQY